MNQRQLLFLAILLFVFLSIFIIVSTKVDTALLWQNISAGKSQPSLPPDSRELVKKAQDKGNVRVIVALRLPNEFRSERNLSAEEIQTQRETINKVRQQLLNNLSTYKATVVSATDEWGSPYVALNVDVEALNYLFSSPLVTGVTEDSVMQLH